MGSEFVGSAIEAVIGSRAVEVHRSTLLTTASQTELTPYRASSTPTSDSTPSPTTNALAVAAVVVYLLVVVTVVFTAPELLASVLIGGIGGMLGVAAGIGVVADARSES